MRSNKKLKTNILSIFYFSLSLLENNNNISPNNNNLRNKNNKK